MFCGFRLELCLPEYNKGETEESEQNQQKSSKELSVFTFFFGPDLSRKWLKQMYRGVKHRARWPKLASK